MANHCVYLIGDLTLLFIGTTFLTLFNISCYEWREFKATPKTSKLTYDFYVQPSVDFNPFLMCYGAKSSCGPIILPVGDSSKNFTNVIAVRIIDRVGDFTEVEWLVQVC